MNTLVMNVSNTLHFSPEQKSVAKRVFVLFVLALALAFLAPAFTSSTNLLNVLRQASLIFLLASGLTFVILCGGLDLSIGANVAMSACLAAIVIKSSGSIALGCAVGIGCGAFIGLLNGVMVTILRIPAFIATYGMMWILHGVTYWFMHGETIHGFPSEFRALGSGYALNVPIPVYLMFIILGVGSYLTQHTNWGQEIYAAGANNEAAELSGVPVVVRRMSMYLLSGLMSGIAALVFLARLNSAEGDMGEALTLQAIAAVLIGGTSLFGGTGTLVGTLIGALILTVVLNGMNLLSVSANWQPMITGVIVILAVLSDAMARKRSNV
jgi:ribose transport system permease protein